MRSFCFLLAVMIGLAAFASAAADDRHDRDSLERYHSVMDSILDDAFSSGESTSRYAAIAYSTSTGKYGYSYNFTSRSAAYRRALAHCKQSDARVVGWAEDGYCALATGKNHAYGVAYGSTAAKARAAALLECRKHSETCEVVICVYSGSAR